MFSYSFAVVGMELFSDSRNVCVDSYAEGEAINTTYLANSYGEASIEESFSYITEALKVLLQLMSNSNWQDPMYAALNEQDGDTWGKAYCYIYFISYHFFATYLMMQVCSTANAQSRVTTHLSGSRHMEVQLDPGRPMYKFY